MQCSLELELKLSNVQWQFIKYLNGRITNASLYRYQV